MINKIQVNTFIRANLFSVALTPLFIGSVFSVRYHSAARLHEDLLYGLPLFFLFILWSKTRARLIYANELTQSVKERMVRDVFLVSYSFYCSSLIFLIFQYDNTDLKGWWLLYMYVSTTIGLMFALVFSLLASCMGAHKIYSLIFCLGIVVILSMMSFFPLRIQAGLFNGYETFWVLILGLIVVHASICFFMMLKKCVNQ